MEKTSSGENNTPPPSFVEHDVMTWSEADYRRLLAEIEQLFLFHTGTPESDRADVLFERIEAYEQAQYQIKEWLETRKRSEPIQPKL